MTVSAHIWIGTNAKDGGDHEGIWRMDRPASGQSWGARPAQLVTEATAPTFLALHPSADRLYAVVESVAGAVASYDVDARCGLTRTRVAPSGGEGPCHLLVHPQGRWLYATNYGDGTVGAIELTESGDVSDRLVALRHTGSGPDPDRQAGPHAHSSILSPGQGYLIVADLGTDELRAYALDGGRPDLEPVLTALPPGCGPRHMVVNGDHLYLACELSGEVLVVRWDEERGRGSVVQRLAAATLPGRSKDVHQLSHILIAHGVVLVGVRGADSISTFAVHDDGARLELVGEIPTATWPRHMAVVGSDLVVAGERADVLVVHPFGTSSADERGSWVGAVGPIHDELVLPGPMCVLPL